VTAPALDRAAELLADSPLEIWEVFLLESSSMLVEVRGGRETLAQRVVDAGVGLRGFAEGRLGFASTTRTDAGGLRDCVQRLRKAASASEPGFPFPLPAGAPSSPAFEAYSPSSESSSLEFGADLAAQAEAAAVRGGAAVSACHCRTGSGRIAIRNSLGLEVSFRFSRASLHLTCEVPSGSRTRFFSSARHGYAAGDLDPRALGEEVSWLARARSQARWSGGERRPLVLSPGAAAQLCACCAPLVSGDGTGAGTVEALGSQAFTLLDDAHLPLGFGSTPFDGEGVATGRHVFVERGVRKARAYTSVSAALAGCRSTGHALRPDFAFPPRLGFHNLHLAPTPGAPDDLVREAGEGLYLVEFLHPEPGGSEAGPELGGWGFRIGGGELAEPLEWELPAMTLGKLLLRLGAVGRDLATFPGGTGGATCLIEAVSAS
jgi:PmbA protein